MGFVRHGAPASWLNSRDEISRDIRDFGGPRRDRGAGGASRCRCRFPGAQPASPAMHALPDPWRNGMTANSNRASSTEGLVLTLNAGSSSLKCAVFRAGAAPLRVLSARFERIGTPEAKFRLTRVGSPSTECRPVAAVNHASCLDFLIE